MWAVWAATKTLASQYLRAEIGIDRRRAKKHRKRPPTVICLPYRVSGSTLTAVGRSLAEMLLRKYAIKTIYFFSSIVFLPSDVSVTHVYSTVSVCLFVTTLAAIESRRMDGVYHRSNAPMFSNCIVNKFRYISKLEVLSLGFASLWFFPEICPQSLKLADFFSVFHIGASTVARTVSLVWPRQVYHTERPA